ncbi:MAG: O-antigen ligase family protein [Phycisphaeraceae bacterium]|nr:O-antigen ligase family protein [Phycisphaeraceae bacterium]
MNTAGLWLWKKGEYAAVHAFDRREWFDRFGDFFHLTFALVAAFCVACPVSFIEVAGAVVLGILLIRLWFIRTCIALLFRQPAWLLALLFVGWCFASIAWSADPAAGFLEAASLRFALFLPVLFPLARQRTPLLIAAALGFAVALVVQAANSVGVSAGIPWLITRDFTHTGRNSGWWPEVVGGGLLVGALGLFLPGALFPSPPHAARREAFFTRAVFTGLSLAAIVGIIATGTRGAWLAGAALVGIALAAAVMLRLRVPRASMRRTLLAAGAAAVLLATLAAGLLLTSESAARRVRDARAEVARAFERDEYETNIGLRIIMVRWAIDALRERPITGVGVGGLRPYIESRRDTAPENERRAIDLFLADNHKHAHNAALHTLATTGLVGGLLSLAALSAAGVALVRQARLAGWAWHGAAPLMGALGMLLLTPFDVFHLTVSLSAFFFFCLALAPSWRPRNP